MKLVQFKCVVCSMVFYVEQHYLDVGSEHSVEQCPECGDPAVELQDVLELELAPVRHGYRLIESTINGERLLRAVCQCGWEGVKLQTWASMAMAEHIGHMKEVEVGHADVRGQGLG